jgi:hypothetical protein
MRRILPALFLLLAVGPAWAAEEAAKGDAKAGAPGTNIDMPFLMAPMNGADGKLAGYAYISSRVTANSDVSANEVRDKIAFIQDAFVRDVNGVSVGKPDDPTQVNMPGLQARLLADARKIMGGAKVASLAIVEVQIAPLHPMQSPGAPPESAPPAAAPAPAAPAKTPQKP